MIGWGKIKHPGGSHPILQQAMMPPIDPAKCRQKIQASGGTSESLYCRFFILHNIVCLLLIRSVFRFTCRICPRYLSKRQIFSFVMTVLRQRPSEYYTLNLAGMLRQFDEVHFLQPQLPFFSCLKKPNKIETLDHWRITESEWIFFVVNLDSSSRCTKKYNKLLLPESIDNFFLTENKLDQRIWRDALL